MVFTEYPYYIALFFLVLATLFIPAKNRWSILLLSSVIFYSYGRWEYLILLFISISIDYFCALGIDQSNSHIKRKFFLFLSITTNLSILLFFKYFIALYSDWPWLESRTALLSIQFDSILLPLGISFYTLQSMGYTIDVYRKEIKPEYHFGYFSLYVCFFPQLVAGPIEKPQNLIPQLRKPKTITTDNLKAGLFLIGFGLFKKLIVSDRLFLIIQDHLASAGELSGLQIMSFGTTAFFAVYFDISAYTDIARGSARLFGINLSLNFNRPMLAPSTTEFWQRWHISLSSWMMRYLFRPLVQLSRSRSYRSIILILTFVIIGLWHGPTLPFVLMGLLQGVVITIERAAIDLRWPKTATFNTIRLIRTHIIISLSGLLFMSPDMSTVSTLLLNLLEFDSFIGNGSFSKNLENTYSLSLLLIGLTVTTAISYIHELPNHTLHKFVLKHQWLRMLLIYLLFTASIAFAEKKSADFLYFFF